MENIINTFYKGNINKFGFGGWNTTKNNIPEILGSYPYPSNANRQIDRYFLKTEKAEDKPKNLHKNYVPSIISQNIPPSERVDFSNSNAQEIKPISISQYKNFDNYGFMNTQIKPNPIPQNNFSPALIRMEYLEKKVADLENKNRAEMQKSLNEINNNYIDPRFKKFLDNNQGKYDVFGNDIDPLDQRRVFVQNNLGNMRNKLDNDEKKERKKRRKQEKKLKKKKKKKKKRKFFEDDEEVGDEEEQSEEAGNAFLTGDNNEENNLNNMTQKSGSPHISPALTRQTSMNQSKPAAGGFRRKSLMATLLKTTMNKTNQNATRRSSIKSKANGRKSIFQSKESKEIKKDNKQTKETNVCGDIGYTFLAKTKKEKELQFQTNRLGKDFDKLFNEINNFKSDLKARMDAHNTEENSRLNVLKDIFLLDGKAKMKFAVDKIINKSNEVFNPIQYQRKVDNEKQEEINDLINKKLDEYYNNLDQDIYSKRIKNERSQMIHNNAIHKFQYKKYRAKLNSQVVTLPNIYIQPTKGIKNRQKKKRKKKIKKGDEIVEVEEESEETDSRRKTDSKYTKSKKSAYVEELSEETVKDFGTSINGNDQYRTKAMREIRRRSETFIELPVIKQSKNNSKILPSNLSEKKDVNEDQGKVQLMKAIEEKEKISKKTKSKKEEEEKKEEEKKEEENKEEEKKEENEKEEKKDEDKKEEEKKEDVTVEKEKLPENDSSKKDEIKSNNPDNTEAFNDGLNQLKEINKDTKNIENDLKAMMDNFLDLDNESEENA